jgi:peptidoglycan/LPS O-acetylase OafA/YrhL
VPLSSSVRSLGHVRALDGLRGVLFLVVLSAHLEPWPNVVGGQVAMAGFFALSGFLITALLVGERAKTGTVSLGRFYGRRALRLGPALVVFLLVWLLIVMVAGGHGWLTTVPGSSASDGGVSRGLALQAVVVALGYVTNWWTAAHLFGGYMPLGHLWSLAVEEQFYLLWAPLLAFLLTRLGRWALTLTLGAAGVSALLPLVYWHGGTGIARIYDGTDTRAAALLLGCAGALVWSRGWLERLSPRVVSLAIGAGAGLLVAAGFAMHNPGSERTWVGGWTLASLGSGLLVTTVVAAQGGFARRLLSTPVLVYVGRRSYALYLWHYAFATWFNDLDLVGYGLTVGASFLAAEISWRLVESPALALKARLEPASTPALGSERRTPIGGRWERSGGAASGRGASSSPSPVPSWAWPGSAA